jgi:glycosyltransferase involved in cell wall biosynthesis
MATMRGQVLAMLLDSAPRVWRSQEESHLQFCRALLARGVRPVLVFSEDLPGELRARFRAAGVEVEAINYGKGVFHYCRQLRQVVRRHSVTAAHIAYFNYFDPIAWLARLNGVRCIVFHERNSGVLRAKGWKKRLIRARTRLMMLPVTYVIAISDYIRRQLTDVGVPEKRIARVYSGVDTSRFSPDPSAREQWAKRFGIQADEAIISSIAYLRPFKHPEVVVEAFALLVERGMKARLFMAGDGEMQPALEELSRRLGVGEKVHWLGNCPDPEFLLQASDIFVLASVGEAFGNAVVEAMACGVPVVGSRSGVIAEELEEGKAGLLATPLDPASFADAIERLIKDPYLRREMGRRGLERVRQHFTTERAVEALLEAYEPIWSG